jgi:carbonic anhydrase
MFGLFAPTVYSQLWNYDEGGTNWEGTCGTGERQSPIDLDDDDTEDIDNRKMSVYYYGYTKDRNIINDGNNIWIDGADFGYIRIDDDGDDYDFYAEKIVFHMPSEHTFNGVHSEMEI